jgi:hypothetical protein
MQGLLYGSVALNIVTATCHAIPGIVTRWLHGTVGRVAQRRQRLTETMEVVRVATDGLSCPLCGGADIREVNVAVLWSRVTAVRGGTVIVESPIYGDWESNGWGCGDCGERLLLPGSLDVDYV